MRFEKASRRCDAATYIHFLLRKIVVQLLVKILASRANEVC